MNRIGTVNELIAILHDCPSDKYRSLAKLIDIPAAEFMSYANWNDSGYTRNCIALTEEFELLLLCWNPGDTTAIHCHGQQRCWVNQISGSLDETIYKKDESGELVVKRTRSMQSGELSYMDDDMGYHSLANNSEAMAMSLHLYAKPIEHCTFFDKALNKFVSKELQYDTFNGEPLSADQAKVRELVLTRLTRSAMI